MSVARLAWRAPEVVQTSAMDCGPAALASVLRGWGRPVSVGRLREACQTDVDGTVIDALETVARQLGLQAEQAMLPADHLRLPEAAALPAIVVVRQPDGATHFVVAWRRLGPWVQVMDPASGRHWVRWSAFAETLFRHSLSVPEADWRAWAASTEGQALFQRRLADLGVPPATARALGDQALADAGWFSLGTLDAALRLVAAVVGAGGLQRGAEAARMLQAAVARVRQQPDHIFGTLPEAYWSVTPDTASTEDTGLLLHLRGAVLVRFPGVAGLAGDGAAIGADPADTIDGAPTALSTDLAAARDQRTPHPMAVVWHSLREAGARSVALLALASALATLGLLVEALLLRGVFDVASALQLPGQRVVAAAALLGFGLLMLGLEWPLVTEAQRLGRQLEARLRLALLAKLPRLGDRYFHSRPVSDMADRAHHLWLARQVPGLGLQALQGLAEVVLTVGGIALIDGRSALWAAAIVVLAVGLPLLAQPLLAERDLRARSHASAMNGVVLDALLGGVPVRTHAAERLVRRWHEGLMVEWLRASHRLVRASLAVEGLQALACTGLAAGLLIDHFLQAGQVTGADLLLVYWALKLPAIGGGLAGLARQYPAHCNVLARLQEPLQAPEEPDAEPAPATGDAPAAPVALQLRQARVVAGGHTLLQGLDLDIAAGEHVAIVGLSGAGKSTLLGLLQGWHRLAGGQLRVDGQPLAPHTLATLRQATAWVDPAVQLWNRSLLDNLVCASEQDGLARVGPVIEAARLRGVLQKLPQGLQTPLGEGGALLSGGEGQRVRLGRALLQTGVRLALLDEPFRGLDRHQRAGLLATARRWWQATTLLCVTHDIGETQGFDRVLVIEDGRLVEDGRPADLAAQDSRYAALLAAERSLQQGLFGDTEAGAWRHLHLADGRLHDMSATGRRTALAAGGLPAGTGHPATPAGGDR